MCNYIPNCLIEQYSENIHERIRYLDGLMRHIGSHFRSVQFCHRGFFGVWMAAVFQESDPVAQQSEIEVEKLILIETVTLGSFFISFLMVFNDLLPFYNYFQMVYIVLKMVFYSFLIVSYLFSNGFCSTWYIADDAIMFAHRAGLM